MSKSLREVELPVCIPCDRVGKLPAARATLKGWCTGPATAPHPREAMVKRVFREVPNQDGDQEQR